jgi:hypothetical protein
MACQLHLQHTPTPPPGRTCYRCGGKHSPETCRYKTATCHLWAPACRLSKARQKTQKPQWYAARKAPQQHTHQVVEELTDADTYTLFVWEA